MSNGKVQSTVDKVSRFAVKRQSPITKIYSKSRISIVQSNVVQNEDNVGIDHISNSTSGEMIGFPEAFFNNNPSIATGVHSSVVCASNYQCNFDEICLENQCVYNERWHRG